MPSFAADDDDDGFGEFKFILSSPSPPSLSSHHHHSHEEEEDDWGDFVQSPQSNSNSNNSNNHHRNHWEKPKGPIPLSIFGVIESEEESSPDPTQLLFSNNDDNNNGFSSPRNAKAARDGKDLIPRQPMEGERDHFDDGASCNRIQAENGVKASMDLVTTASLKEREAYIAAWSRVAHACAKELRHGAMIWKESVDANVSKEMLSRGQNYFAALVEIYGVTEILRASLKLYKPWTSSTLEDRSRELMGSLDKCAEAWATSGIGKTLETASATGPNLGRLLSDIDELSSKNHAFDHDSVICRLSLLPMDKLQGLKVVTWNGHTYCLKLANFWANRVSCHPPQLPHICASEFRHRADNF